MAGPEEEWTGEAGGHRFQRTPPTERSGRVHTSTVTVATHADEPGASERVELDLDDVRVTWFSGTGKGGQNRNKVQASCRVLHVPTGLEAKAERRTRHDSFRSAVETLRERLAQRTAIQEQTVYARSTRSQVGTGQRGDKTRTYRLQADEVIDHRHGWRKRWTDVAAGRF